MLYDYIKDDELRKMLLLCVLKIDNPDRTDKDIKDAKSQLVKYGYTEYYLNELVKESKILNYFEHEEIENEND